jgi:hypothetical protein
MQISSIDKFIFIFWLWIQVLIGLEFQLWLHSHNQDAQLASPLKDGLPAGPAWTTVRTCQKWRRSSLQWSLIIRDIHSHKGPLYWRPYCPHTPHVFGKTFIISKRIHQLTLIVGRIPLHYSHTFDILHAPTQKHGFCHTDDWSSAEIKCKKTLYYSIQTMNQP